MGALTGDTLRCMYHGLCYDTEGKCVQIPGQTHIPAKAWVRAFPVLERYEFLRENVRRTFDEDKDMLEAQQRNIGDGESEMGFKVAIRADAGPTQGRRLLASMIEAEARGSIS